MTGEFQHSVDAKGRLFVPAKFREELGGKFVITKGLDNCLFVYPSENWRVLEEKIRALPLSKARLQRFFLSSAVECELDSQGRINIPQALREHAMIERDATIIGVSTRAEIWDTKHWNAYNSAMTAENIAEAMDEIGF